MWSGREDLNLRPPEPHSGALPGCATPRLPCDLTTHRKGINRRQAIALAYAPYHRTIVEIVGRVVAIIKSKLIT